MGKTAIAWTDESWNPVVGCTPISAGCANCYAKQLHDMRWHAYHEWNGHKLPECYALPFEKVQCLPERLNDLPLKGKARRVFVCSMADLFHPDVPHEFLLRVMEEIERRPQMTFQVLTKRPERMREFFWGASGAGAEAPALQNLWLGVTAENQEQAEKRIPILLQVPAVEHFVSVEPMLGAVDLKRWLGPVHMDEIGAPENQSKVCGFEMGGMCFPASDTSPWYDGLSWVICGGESGPHARPMHPQWVRDLRNQCQAAGVPFFFKQWGEYAHVESGVLRVGTKVSGDRIDGVQYHEFPEVTI